MSKKVMIVAGEASGDQRAAELVTAVRQRDKDIEFFGVGGEDMRTAGVRTVIDLNTLLVMGFIEVLWHLPRILKIMSRVKELLRTERPDLLILVDYPGFNLRVAETAKKLGVKVLFYVSPQVWAWRQGRVKHIVNVVDHMAVLFPFEKKFYEGYGLPVTYVGHPLVAKIKTAPSQQQARASLGLVDFQPVIALCPGSRSSELERFFPRLLKSAEKISHKFPKAIFVVAQASTIKKEVLFKMLSNFKSPVKVVESDSLRVMSAADVIITASGTATLEAALLNKPMVVVYCGSWLSAWLARKLIKIPYVSLCNIVAGERIVLELLQEDFTAENVTREACKILVDGAYRATMISKLSSTNKILEGADTGERLSAIVLEML